MTDRAHLYRVITDNQGNVNLDALTVSVYLPGTTTLIPDTLFSDNTGSTGPSNPFAISTGIVDFYLDTPQRVDLKVDDGSHSVIYHDVDVLEVVVSGGGGASAPIGYVQFNFQSSGTLHDGDFVNSPSTSFSNGIDDPVGFAGAPGWTYSGGTFDIDVGLYAITTLISVNPISESGSAPHQAWRVHFSLNSFGADLVIPGAAFDPLGDVWFTQTSSWQPVNPAVSGWTPQYSMIDAPSDLAVSISMSLRVVRFAIPT